MDLEFVEDLFRADFSFLIPLIASYMLLKCFYFTLRHLAWNVSIPVDDILNHPGKQASGWGMAGPTPGFDARGLYQLATHTPIYLMIFVYALLRFPFEILKANYLGWSKNRISDADVFDLCTKTSLVLFCRFDVEGRFIFEMPEKVPSKFPVMGNCHLATMKIVFTNSKIEEACSQYGDVTDTDILGRNEILLAALRHILGHWLHPTIHLGAEKSALEIQMKRVSILEPSCHFVSSLHDGLLHGTLSPSSEFSPFYCGTETREVMMENVHSFPFPQHIISKDKNTFDIYEYAIAGRSAIHKLVREYQLNVNSENLFLNLIMHEIDHSGCYSVLSRLPLFSLDGTGSYQSYWKMYCFTHVWLHHWDNPLNSDLLSSNLNNPFYRDLYEMLRPVNQEITDLICVSCCF